MKFIRKNITFQEVPDETSLCYEITNCPYRCKDCHSPELQTDVGEIILPEVLKSDIEKYINFITCVLFMGGDQNHCELISLLNICKSRNLKTCLYTGSNDVSDKIKTNLDYLKTGHFNKLLGGLNSPNTNQRFIHVPSGKNLNKLFL